MKYINKMKYITTIATVIFVLIATVGLTMSNASTFTTQNLYNSNNINEIFNNVCLGNISESDIAASNRWAKRNNEYIFNGFHVSFKNSSCKVYTTLYRTKSTFMRHARNTLHKHQYTVDKIKYINDELTMTYVKGNSLVKVKAPNHKNGLYVMIKSNKNK